jgi:hypothetical protein
MSKKFMPEVSDKDRMLILQQNADKMEDTKYYKPLTEDELTARREMLTDNCIKLGDLEEEKKLLTEKIKVKIDPLKEENKMLLLECRTKQVQVSGILYHMADHENGYMETYDHNGELLYSRKLRPDEKQLRATLAIAQ